MPNPLAVLLLEDDANDAELLLEQLRLADFEPHWQRVQSESEYLDHLSPQLDLILADFDLPQLDGLAALRLRNERGLDVPFVIVSGAIGEEHAVVAVRDGAADYLVKDRLSRLGPAVTRALEQKRIRQAKIESEALLAQSEKHFRSLIDHAPDAIVLLGADGKLSYASPSTTRITGYLPQEVIGRDPATLTHPQDLPLLLTQLQELQSHPGASATLQYRFLHRDDSWRWIESTITNMLGQPEVHAFVFNYRDITERKVAEESLRSSEELLRAVLTAINVHLAVLDPDGMIILVNPSWDSFARANGDPHLLHTGIGTNYLEVCRRSARANEPIAAEALAGLEAVMAGSAPAFTLEYPCDSPIEQRWFLMHATPLPYNGGALVSHINITARGQAEQSERDQRTLAEALSDTAAALNSTLDVEKVLERVLANAQRVVPHDAATVMLLEGDQLRVVGSRGYQKVGTEQIISMRLNLDETRNLRELVRTGQPVIVGDTREYAGWLHTPVTAEIRSTLAAPIRHQGNLIGLISLDCFSPHAFTSVHAERLLTFADQVAIALENARLFQETRTRLAELEAIHKVAMALRTVHRLDEMLPLLLGEILELLGTAVGSIWLYDPVAERVSLAVQRGWLVDAPLSYALGEGIPGKAVESGQAYYSRDFKQDLLTHPAVRAGLAHGQGGACVPIRTADRIVGLLFLGLDSDRDFTPSELSLLTTVTEIAGNTIYRMRLLEASERQLDRLASLRMIENAISGSVDLGVTLHILLDQLVARVQVDAASLLLLNSRTNVLEWAATRGFRSRPVQMTPLRLGHGLAGRVALERQVVNIPNLAEADLPANLMRLFTQEGFAAYYGIPLITKGTVTGVLELFERSTRPTDPEWIDFVQALAGQAAIAIDNAALFENLQQSNLQLVAAYDDTIEGWSRALDLRDKETEGHTLRVTQIALLLARHVGLVEVELVQMKRGALLHDIGKMGVPDKILLKEGPLTNEEWVIMRAHPTLAYEMLLPIVYLHPALDIPYCHHEKWDGTGYPRGLQGEEIPLAARIFAVVDVWDALRSDRPYRKAWSVERARAYILEQKGLHFDPRIVELFMELDLDP